MSNSQDRPTLHAMAQRAYILKTSRGHSRTVLLFSITDRRTIAWYLFFERFTADAELAHLDDAEAGKRRQVFFGRRRQSMAFKPRVPRPVNGFAATKSNELGEQTVAIVDSRFVGPGQLQLTPTLLLGDSNESFRMLLTTKDGKELPSRREVGKVVLLHQEAYSEQQLEDTRRFRQSMLNF